MGHLTIISDKEAWDKAHQKLAVPSVLASFDMVNASTLLYPGDGAVAEAALYEENGAYLFYPYIKRPCPYQSEMFDICSAYEFGGFWFSTEEESTCKQLVSGFEPAFRAHALQANIVSEFIRVNPFCKISGLGWKDYELKKVGEHIIIPTKSGMDAAWADFHGSRRTQIRQGQKEGLRTEFSEDTKTFTEIYHKRLDGLNSYRFYYFPESYLQELGDKKIIFVYDNLNEICGSQLYIEDHKVLFYFLSADVYEKRHAKPNGFLIYEMMQWACENNIDYIHLGGGIESLHHYKSLFSPHRIDYYLAKRIINHAAYEALVAQHQQANGELENKGYFPLYRLDTTDSHKVADQRRYTATGARD